MYSQVLPLQVMLHAWLLEMAVFSNKERLEGQQKREGMMTLSIKYDKRCERSLF